VEFEHVAGTATALLVCFKSGNRNIGKYETLNLIVTDGSLQPGSAPSSTQTGASRRAFAKRPTAQTPTRVPHSGKVSCDISRHEPELHLTAVLRQAALPLPTGDSEESSLTVKLEGVNGTPFVPGHIATKDFARRVKNLNRNPGAMGDTVRQRFIKRSSSVVSVVEDAVLGLYADQTSMVASHPQVSVTISHTSWTAR